MTNARIRVPSFNGTTAVVHLLRHREMDCSEISDLFKIQMEREEESVLLVLDTFVFDSNTTEFRVIRGKAEPLQL